MVRFQLTTFGKVNVLAVSEGSHPTGGVESPSTVGRGSLVERNGTLSHPCAKTRFLEEAAAWAIVKRQN